MNIINNRFYKTIVLVIAFISPFLTLYCAFYAERRLDSLRIPLIMHCILISIWSVTTYLSVYLKITANKNNKLLILSSNLIAAIILSVHFIKLRESGYLMKYGLPVFPFLDLILSWIAFIYIKRNQPQFNILNFIIMSMLVLMPWFLFLLSLSVVINHFDDSETLSSLLLVLIVCSPYIFSVFFAVKRNLNIYSYGILTINQIIIWPSIIMGIFSLFIPSGKSVLVFSIAAILYVSMVYMNGTTYFRKIKSIVNTVFGENSFANNDGLNSATNLVQVSNGIKGKCFVFNRDTGAFLIIALNENKVIGFDYSDFAAAETDSGEIGSIRMTLRFYDRNNPVFSILSDAVPKAIQYIGDAYPRNPTSGFREHVKRVLNAKFPKNKWQMD